jgi:hypothetical protein
MAKNGINSVYDDAGFPSQAAFTAALPANGGVQVVKGSAGRLLKVVVTTATTTSPVTIYDSAAAAAGTILLVIPAAAAAGTIYDVNLPAVNGIVVNGAAAAGAITVGYS